jgi:mono/diheme cytochrome c family protein
MQWWMNGVAYPYLISGKPLVSVPASWPVAFELTVLFSAFTTVIAMILLNGLPRFSNPLLSDEKFLRSTSDQFVLSIDARDPKFGGALDHLRGLGTAPETVYTDPGSHALPKIIPLAGLIIVSALMIPPVLIAKARVSTKSVPRWHFIWDMDFQPKFKAQRENLLFTDLRAMRPQEAGTVARGELEEDDAFFRGLKSDGGGQVEAAQVSQQLIAQAQPADAADGAAAPADGAPPPDPLDKLPWVTEFPVAVTGQLMKRGQERYNIYCSTCHGLAGDGDGLITQRAMELEQGTWIRPVTYHSDAVRNQPVGRLFHTITNGVRKMPPMGDVIPPEDRWAILLYMRALQRSRHATPADVPADVLPQLKDVPQ